MWPSSGRNKNSSSSRSTSKSKSSSSTCSSPAPFSPSSSSLTRTTMEEVWRDISVSSLNDHSNSTLTNNINNYNNNNNNQRSNYPSLILQDFLARPSNNDPPPRGPSSEPSFPSSKSPLATMLSLNSGSGYSDVQYPERGPDPARPNQKLNGHHSLGTCAFACPHNTGLDAMGSPTVFPPYCKKRVSENDDYSEDRRYKRMIKNRESAARSRARKQAYTNELELEVAHLLEENAKLKKQQEKLLEGSAAQLSKKNSLYRTSTAPF